MTDQSTLREALDYIKNESGKGSKKRKQEKFREVYTPNVACLVTGERYDDAGVGPVAARDAVAHVFPDVDYDDYDTLTESLIGVSGGDEQSLEELVADLDGVAQRSGQDQKDYLASVLEIHSEPSLVTLALLDDETIGLGTSQMREAFFDGTRDERKHHESFVSTTREFIDLAQKDDLPDGPTVGEPFAPMLAVPESRGQPEKPLGQPKVDGYRCLLHIEDGDVTAYSRAQNDVTESLPELNEVEFPQGDYILDGEVMAETGSYSDTSSRIGKKAENVERDIEMVFHAFDILVDDGEHVYDKEYTSRYSKMRQVVHDADSDYVNALKFRVSVETAKDDAIEQGGEGIIVKGADSPYEFGKRSTHWQKVKLDAETVDVVIAGFTEGDGEASGTLGHIQLESADGVYVGNSGSGFTEAERDEIWNNQGDWLGRTVEIEARGLGSEDKLRMPIYKKDRSDDGEPDDFDRIKEVMKDI